MSKPRAAMSVATNILMELSLKFLRAFVLAPWLLLPWIAAAEIPALINFSVSLLAPCLVLVKTKTWFQFPSFINLIVNSVFLFLSTLKTLWVTFFAVEFCGSASTETGFLKIPSANFFISLENVAENIKFWRFAGI